MNDREGNFGNTGDGEASSFDADKVTPSFVKGEMRFGVPISEDTRYRVPEGLGGKAGEDAERTIKSARARVFFLEKQANSIALELEQALDDNTVLQEEIDAKDETIVLLMGEVGRQQELLEQGDRRHSASLDLIESQKSIIDRYRDAYGEIPPLIDKTPDDN